MIRFELDREGAARVDVYDLSGRHVRTLVDGHFDAGEHQTAWRGRDGAGHLVASGVYLLRLHVDDFNETRRVTLIK